MSSNENDIRDRVRESYGKIAADEKSGCCGSSEPSSGGSSCCGGGDADEHAVELGYEFDDLSEIPEEANLGLGCGNPTAIANLEPGQVVLDLGSGAGMDVFLAASKVGDEGRVLGVDMTPEMLARARRTAVEQGVADHVEFREGLIEEIPVVSERVDVVLSNCVVNLSPDKPAVFREAFRVLKPGGRLAVTDICLTEPLPEPVREAAAAHVACIGGAMQADDYLDAIREAGFTDLDWSRTSAAPMFEAIGDDPVLAESLEELGEEGLAELEGIVWSYRIEAQKP
jgi:SAM-dependent methyltransferase